MRRMAVKTLVFALVLGIAGIGLAQQTQTQPGQPGQSRPPAGAPSQKAPAEKSKLEEMLAEALKSNPDIRVAAAKLAEADAELNRTRLQVMQKVVTLHHAIETQKKTVAHQESRYQRLEALAKTAGAISSDDLEEGRQAIALAKAKLEELEAQVPALLGKRADAEMQQQALAYQLRLELIDLYRSAEVKKLKQQELESYYKYFQGSAELTAKTAGPMAERIRKALQTPVKVSYKSMAMEVVVKDLMKKAPGLTIRLNPQARFGFVSLEFDEPLPLSAVLQALEDDFNLRFIVRDYGILVPNPEEIPPGAMTLQEFLRKKPEEEPRRELSVSKNPPAENVEGLVKKVDSSGLVTLTIGSDVGLAKGHTLELYRLNSASQSQSRYLGTLRIIEVEAKQAVAQPVGRLTSPPQSGDRVASRLLGG